MALVDAPPRAVSATLTEREPFGGTGVLAPGDEISLLYGRFRVAEIGVGGLRLVPTGRVRLTLTVTVAPTADGVLVTCEARATRAFPLRRRHVLYHLQSIVDIMRTRAVAMAGGQVIVGAAIVRDRTVLAQQRAYPPAVAGRWELPGGRVEPGESDVDAVARECAEELGIKILVGETVGPDIALPEHRVLRVYQAELADHHQLPHPHDHQALRWLTPGRLGQVTWLPADRVLLPTLRRLLR
ncbi:(deoxy)nucleoside triphosphate pyrophosphohydrolase [Actinophytocola sediminis]